MHELVSVDAVDGARGTDTIGNRRRNFNCERLIKAEPVD